MYTYSITNDTLNAKANTWLLDTKIKASNITIALESVSTSEDSLTIEFKTAISSTEKTTLDGLVSSHNGLDQVKVVPPLTEVQQLAFSANHTEDGKTLYLKIHGMKAVLPAATLDVDGVTIIPTEHEFLFTLPYTESYLQGAEIFVDILAQTDMSVKHPVYGVVEQYGYDVCMGKVIYKREAKYAARLPAGLQVSAICKNVELVEQEMGVNFILHEIRV